MSKRILRSAGSTTAQTLDTTKNYKFNSAGTLVEATTIGDNDIIFSGSKSSLRRISDIERNVSILAAKTLTTDAGTASVTSADKWATARTITLGGDLSGSVSIDGSSNVTLSATVAANSVALGTDTTGNYMVNVSAGTGISVSHTQGEGSTATISSTITQYTDALARGAVSFVAGSGAYNSTTGVITIPTNTNQLTNGASFATTSYVDTAVAGKDNTDEITEGTTNLYFTNARARGAVSVTDSGGDGSLSYNSTTGVITYTGPSAAEVRAHFTAGTGITITSGAIATTITQYTDALARGAVSFAAGSGAYNSTTGVFTIPTNTSQLTNGAAFITTAGARSAVSAGTGISYNSTTGVITNTITQYTNALARGAVSVTDSGGDGSLSYNSTTGVITYAGPSAAEVRAHFTAGTGITITSGAIATTITQYTDALARGAVSFTAGSGAYNSTTGVFTIPTNTNQLTNGASFINTVGARVAVSAGTGISYDSSTGVITNTITQYTDELAVSANTSAIDTAKSEAISTAAADATTKANAAQAAAIAAVTNGAGAAFDTLKEIQDAMATDTELSAAIAAISNVPSATKLQTARTINGVSFDGTANISFSTTAVGEGTNLYYTDARARAAHSFVAGSGAYNSTTGVITIPTNTSQLTNGAGYVTSSGVTAVTATGPVASSGGATPVISMPAATASVDGFMTSTFATKLNGIAAGATNVTNTNQLTNGAGYITSSASISGNAATATAVTNTVSGTNSAELVRGNMGDNDQFRILVGATSSNAGYVEIATADDGSEPIHVRQYTGVFTSLTRTATLLDASGNTSFPGTMSHGALTVSGAITATGEVTAYFSDKRLKTNIVPIAEALDKVESISGYTFDPNETALALGVEDRHQMGVIAQEVEAVAPELVCDSAFDGYKTVRYDKLTALLIEAVKELSAKVKTLEAQIGTKGEL